MHPNLRRCLVLLVQRISGWTSYIWPEFIGRNSMEGINSAILSRFCQIPGNTAPGVGYTRRSPSQDYYFLSLEWFWSHDLGCDLTLPDTVIYLAMAIPGNGKISAAIPVYWTRKIKIYTIKRSFIYFNTQSKWALSTVIFNYTCISHLYLYNFYLTCIHLLYLCIFYK